MLTHLLSVVTAQLRRLLTWKVLFFLTNGGSILGNGLIKVNSAPNLPFFSGGEFQANSNLVFLSGTLGGVFNFQNVNFSGAAAKSINGTTTVAGVIVAQLPTGTQGLITIVGGQLVVEGTMMVSQTLTIASSNGGKLNVPGLLDFEGSSSSNILTILGTAYVATLQVGGGNIVLNDDVTIGLAKVANGAQVTMIGANTVQRVFSDVSGQGTLNIQGGTNTFHTMSNINNVILSGGILAADTKQCNVGTFSQTGGSISGTATFSANIATLSNAVINNTPVTAATLNLKGVANLNGGSLTVTGTGVVQGNSQLTLASGALFYVSTAAKVSQGFPLQVLPSGVPPPTFKNDGKWTSTSPLTLNTLTNGAGSFEIGSGSSLSATGITFSTTSILLTSSIFNCIGTTFTVGSIDGTAGTIVFASQTFTVTGSMTVSNFTQKNGQANIATGTITALDLQSGTFDVTGSGLTATNFTWEGGELLGTGSNAVTVMTATLTGTMPHQLSSITLSAPTVLLSCGASQCILESLNARLTTGPPA